MFAPLDIGIEHGGCAHLHCEIPPVFDWLDDDHLRGAHDPAGLGGADADRAGAKHDDVAAGLELHEARAGGEPRRQLIAEQTQLRRRDVGKDRDAVFLEDDHQLGEAADAGFGVDRRAVRHFRKRGKVVAAGGELAVVRAPVETLVAGAALRGARDDNAVAALNATHVGADGFHHALPAVIGNLCAPRLIRPERAPHARVARCRRLDPHGDLTRLNRLEPEIFEADPGAVPHEAAETSPCLSARLDGRGL